MKITQTKNLITVSWPKADPAWKLVFTSQLGTADTNAWTLILPPYPTNVTDYVVTETAPVANKFYRLRKP